MVRLGERLVVRLGDRQVVEGFRGVRCNSVYCVSVWAVHCGMCLYGEFVS